MHPKDPTSRRSATAGALPEEVLLLAQLREGDVEAGRRFVRDYYPSIYHYLLYLTGRPDWAEDLAQETFLQAWRHLDRLVLRAPLQAWLHRIAHREFLQALRSRRVQFSLETTGEAAAPASTAPLEAVELRAVIRKLPIEEREIVVLHYLQGYGCGEIARIIRSSVSMVKYRLTTARSYLLRELGDGDLAYLNEPSVPMRQWAWLPLDQMYALETRLTRRDAGERAAPGRGGTTEDSMERREFLRQAAVGAAGLMLPEAEKEVVDARLTQKVTLAFKGTALADLCEHLRGETGIQVTAGPTVADEKVTLFCEKLPLREVMRQLSRPFGYTWLRSGTPGQYRYELQQDLRSQLLEEELRNQDRNAAFLALEREIERYRGFLDLSPDEALARAKSAPSQEKPLLERLAGYGWGGIQMYFRLTPQQQAALRAGENLQFSQEPGGHRRDGSTRHRPEGVVDGGMVLDAAPKGLSMPLPPDIARGVLQSLRDVFFYHTPDGIGIAVGVKEPGPGHLPLTTQPEARATVRLSIRATAPGRIALTYAAGAFSQSSVLHNSGGSWTQGDGTLAVGASPMVLKPDNRAANARLAGDPSLRRPVAVHPEGHCSAPSVMTGDGQTVSASTPEKQVSIADALEALHRATGLPLVADFFTRLYSLAAVTVTEQPLFDALNRLADTMRLRWSKDEAWLQFRSTSFYDDRVKEVPNRLLSRWAQERSDAGGRRQHGILTLNDLVEIAGLTDNQLDAADMAEGARDCWGLVEWNLARDQTLRPHLRFLAELTPAQRQEAMNPAGLPFTKLSLAQQQRYLALALASNDRPLQSLVELDGATLRVDYTQPGGFEWLPPASNVYHWVVPIVPGPEGRRALRPPVRGRTREQALAAARRLDPRLLEALLPEARRVKPEIRDAPMIPEAGEIGPTGLRLWVVYIPGLSNRRSILVIGPGSESRLSSG